MKHSSRIQACIDIFEKLEGSRVPMDALVGDYMRSRRYIGAKDRADIAERCYSVTRSHARLKWWLERAEAPITPRMMLLAYVVIVEGASESRVKELFDGSNFAPSVLSNDEIAVYEHLKGNKLNHPDMPDAVRVECPPEYEETLRGMFGDDFVPEMEAMLKSAPLDMRVNVFILDRDKAKESLEKSGVEVFDTPLSPWGLRAKGKVFLSKTTAYLRGYVEIQDEGSQLIAYVCDAQPGMQVLDYCAGGGGKTLALGAAMKRKGRIVAMDLESRRLEKAKPRYKKAQIADIIEVRPLDDERHRKWFKRQTETFDVVLIDAPCTGTGTWRRNPDTRWKYYGPKIEDLLAVQAEILDKVAFSVKKGGKLVYATCSLLPEENERQVDKFLAAHPDFTVQPVDEKLGKPYMRLTPYRHNTDAFFAAVLVKTA